MVCACVLGQPYVCSCMHRRVIVCVSICLHAYFCQSMAVTGSDKDDGTEMLVCLTCLAQRRECVCVSEFVSMYICVCVQKGGVLLKQGCQHLKNQSPSGLISYKRQREGMITLTHTSWIFHFIQRQQRENMYSSDVPACFLPSFCFKWILKNSPHLDPAGIKAGAISSYALTVHLTIFKSEVTTFVTNGECRIGDVEHGRLVFLLESTGHTGAYLSH